MPDTAIQSIRPTNHPHNITDEIEQSEQTVLGRIIWNPELIDIASMKISYQDFRYERNQIIYWAIGKLKEKEIPIDVLSLCNFLRRKKSRRGKLMDRIKNGPLYVLYLVEIVLADEIKEVDREIDSYLEKIKYKGAVVNG